jgi:hypothetical protein
MEVRIVACGIFQPELDQVLQEIRLEQQPETDIKVTYVAPALHVDYDKLKNGIIEALDQVNEDKRVLLFGAMCHPEIAEFTEKYHVVRLPCGNCIELILGLERQREIDSQAKVFYLTPGWLLHWRDIFQQGQGWDEIDARQNMGYYDKALLLDTGTAEYSDEDLLEFFEYTQVPAEIMNIDLSVFKAHVVEALRKALEG